LGALKAMIPPSIALILLQLENDLGADVMIRHGFSYDWITTVSSAELHL